MNTQVGFFEGQSPHVESVFTPRDRDDIAHSLGQAFAVHGRKLDAKVLRVWLEALAGFTADEIRTALQEHIRTSTNVPKPAAVIEIARTHRSAAQARIPHEEKPFTRCPQDIADAWIWFQSLCLEGSRLGGTMGVAPPDKIDPDTREKYLRIVNEEARKFDQPDAIPDEYKIAEVWR